MKQCPKCNFTCQDSDAVCTNCGYLFTPEGFEDRQAPSPNRNGNFPQQNNMPPQNGNFPQQGNVPPQNGNFPQQGNVPPQNGNFPQQGNMPPQNGNFSQQGNMPPQNGNFPPQGNMPPQNPGFYGSTPFNQGSKPIYVESVENGLSIASLVLGIIGVVGICCDGIGAILGILALVFGIISNSKIKKSNGLIKGRGMTTAGIILGIIAIVFGLAYMIYIITHYQDYMQEIQNFMQNYSSNG